MKKKPSMFTNFIRSFQISSNSIKVFDSVSNKPMTIRQIIDKTKLSERTVRSCLSELIRKQFIKKELLLEDHLKYLYKPDSTENIIDGLKRSLSSLNEKHRSRK